MPLVKLRYKDDPILFRGVLHLTKELPKIVAEALNSSDPEGHLEPKDVEVEICKADPNDLTHYDFYVLVEANDYPERRRNLDERRKKIADAFWEVMRPTMKPGDYIRHYSGFVWVKLCPGSFGEIDNFCANANSV